MPVSTCVSFLGGSEWSMWWNLGLPSSLAVDTIGVCWSGMLSLLPWIRYLAPRPLLVTRLPRFTDQMLEPRRDASSMKPWPTMTSSGFLRGMETAMMKEQPSTLEAEGISNLRPIDPRGLVVEGTGSNSPVQNFEGDGGPWSHNFAEPPSEIVGWWYLQVGSWVHLISTMAVNL